MSLGADVNLHYQGVVSYVSPVPAFATRIKMKWSNQSSALFTDQKIDPVCQCFKRWHNSDNPLTIQRWNMFMVISSLVCFTHWLTCRLMGMTSLRQFGQFRYTHVHPLEVACLNGNIRNLNCACMSLLWALCFGKRGSTTTAWIHFVVKQWNMAHATYVLLLTKLVLGPLPTFWKKGHSSDFAPPTLTLVSNNNMHRYSILRFFVQQFKLCQLAGWRRVRDLVEQNVLKNY